MTRPVDVKAIEAATGRSWDTWLDFMRSITAQVLTHKEIAERVERLGAVDGWWAQTITVAYEQHIGRRAPGQTSAGDYQLAVSRSLPGDMDAAMAAWLALAGNRASFDEMPLASPPRVTSTDRWRYWRADLVDGSTLTVSASDKGPGKALLALSHEKLPSAEFHAQWRRYWKALLSRLD